MLVDSCSFELICVLVDQYVIQYFLVCQYLHSFLSPFQFYFSTITEQEGQLARLRKYQDVFSRRLLYSESHPWNPSPAPHLKHRKKRGMEVRGGGWHQAGSGSLLQPGKQGTGEQIPELLPSQRPAWPLLYLKAEYQKPFSCLFKAWPTKECLLPHLIFLLFQSSFFFFFFQEMCCFSKGKRIPSTYVAKL